MANLSILDMRFKEIFIVEMFAARLGADNDGDK
eukprot:CAMPEP_0117418778 /NCGR_PEP_ID=MMETSP0758-20121206/490_1 /TAXON_ID=63605 /ORGANISM="Percolomonas cosmopolitus, Strain AE-1 (ATCC 50343)" /LENGTH=32 /DNA_ID= /DNA_START= /DNA_END= /DNA_ORIENTATION=